MEAAAVTQIGAPPMSFFVELSGEAVRDALARGIDNGEDFVDFVSPIGEQFSVNPRTVTYVFETDMPDNWRDHFEDAYKQRVGGTDAWSAVTGENRGK